jgi:cardiolipin synthase
MNPMRRLLEKSRHPETARPWSGEKLYFRGDDYFRDLLKSVQRAKKSVDFETYIFEKGWLGDRVVSVLAHAARRGVRVRLLVDGVGSPDFASHYGPLLKKQGIRFRVYRSWPSLFTSLSLALWFQGFGHLFRNLRRIWNWGGHRDHRKLCVVDGQRVWVGGFNVSDFHLEKRMGRRVWRDTGIGLAGVKSYVFQLAFHLAWEEQSLSHLRLSYKKMLVRWLSHDVLEGPVRLNVTRHLRRVFNHRFSERIISAQKRIWITTPYFVPTRDLFRALLKAARKGLDVRLVLPGLSDVPMVKWASTAFYPRLLRAGCRIFEYQGRVLHAKTLLVDRRAYVGSSNLNHRSLLHDLEIIVLPQRRQSLRTLEGQFGKDLLQCREITLLELKRRPFLSRLLSVLFFQFRYWF